MLFSISRVSTLLLFVAPILASPVPQGTYVPPARTNTFNCGCQSRKAALIALGATTLDITVGLQETGSTLSGSSYTLYDYKTGDSACFSFLKLNWYAIRTACSDFQGKTAADYGQGEVLNRNDAMAIKCMHEQLNYFRGNNWFIVHRDGAGALGAPMSYSATEYANAVNSNTQYMQSHLYDNLAQSSELKAQ